MPVHPDPHFLCSMIHGLSTWSAQRCRPATFGLIRKGDGNAIAPSFEDDLWLEDLACLHGNWGERTG
jgi:hypothetical protein